MISSKKSTKSVRTIPLHFHRNSLPPAAEILITEPVISSVRAREFRLDLTKRRTAICLKIVVGVSQTSGRNQHSSGVVTGRRAVTTARQLPVTNARLQRQRPTVISLRASIHPTDRFASRPLAKGGLLNYRKGPKCHQKQREQNY